MLLPMCLYAEDNFSEDPTVVDDGDKTSGRVNDIINGVETATKAMDAYNTAKTAKNTYNQVKQIKNLKDVKSFAIGKLKAAVTQYKSCKYPLLTWLSHVSNKMATVLDKCNDRVNMWRTTEPMLINYYKSMGKLSNNTLQVFKDFEISDMVDIDRKWSRKMEGQLNQDASLAYSFFAFATSRFDYDYYRKKYAVMFFTTSIEKDFCNDEERMAAYLEIKDNVNEFNKVPFTSLVYASDALTSVRAIADQAHSASKDDPSVSDEEHNMELIENSLKNESATYNDIVDNGVLIADKRTEISIQRTQLNQIFSELQTRYSRLLLRRHERMAIEYEDIDNTLNKLVNGGKFQTIDEARMERFGKDAGMLN